MKSQALTNHYLSKFGHLNLDSTNTLNILPTTAPGQIPETAGLTGQTYPVLIPSPPGNEGNTLPDPYPPGFWTQGRTYTKKDAFDLRTRPPKKKVATSKAIREHLQKHVSASKYKNQPLPFPEGTPAQNVSNDVKTTSTQNE